MKIMKKIAAVVMFGLLSVNVASANSIVKLPGDLRVLQAPFDMCIDRSITASFALYEFIMQNPDAKITAEDEAKIPGLIKEQAEKDCIGIYSKVVKGEEVDIAFLNRLVHVENYITVAMDEDIEPAAIRAYFAEVHGSYELIMKYLHIMENIEEE